MEPLLIHHQILHPGAPGGGRRAARGLHGKSQGAPGAAARRRAQVGGGGSAVADISVPGQGAGGVS